MATKKPTTDQSSNDSAQDQQRFSLVRELYQHASSLPPNEQLTAIRARTDDELLVREVVELLNQKSESDSTIDDDTLAHQLRDAIGAAAAEVVEPDTSATASLPDQIGDYRIIREINRGGMGVVYEAEQDEPRRRVALKLVASGLASPALVDRFRLEAHALGRLDHPGIARILQAGTFDSGSGTLPFFAMELVDGKPITKALSGASLHKKLTVLADTAEAVHHAHLRGVVHRDLKPSNVLVNAEGRTRVVDFGVARLLDPDPDAPDTHTLSGHLLGTPAYMSPEQVIGNPDLIDARADIYALGGLAYEVLSDKPPLELQSQSLEAQLKSVREVTPRLLGPTSGVPRDVGIVLAMALEKDPSRRHASAAAFADDLRRARDGHTISGRAPSVTYQLSRLAARHPIGTGLIAASLALLIAGVTVISVLLGRSIEAESRAANESRIARNVTGFLIEDVFGAVSPEVSGTETITVDQLVDDAAGRAVERFSDDPQVGREVLRALAEVDLNLGRFTSASARLDEIDALPLQAPSALSNDEAVLARSEALQLVRAGVAWREGEQAVGIDILSSVHRARLSRLGANHRDTLDAAHRLAVLRADVDFDQGMPELLTSLANYERVFGKEHRLSIEVAHDISLQYLGDGRFEEALPYAERVASSFSKLNGETAWLTVHSLVTLGEVYRGTGDFDAAMSTYELAMQGFEERGTPKTSFHRISLEANMGLAQMEAGNLEAAEPFLDRAIANGIAGGEEGTAPFETLRHNYGALKMLLGRHDEADQILEAVFQRRVSLLGRGDFETLMTRGLMGENRRRAGRAAEALAPLKEAWEGLVDLFGKEDNFALRTAERIAQVYEALGEVEAADTWKERAARPNAE